jgi:subtilisin
MERTKVMRTKIFAAVLVGVLVISCVSAALAIPANDNAAGLERVPVLIGFSRVPGPSEQALVRGRGGVIKYSYHLVPGIAASIPEAAIEGLLHNPNVTNIDPDIKVYAVDAELNDSWGVKRIGAGTVHDGGNLGTGVKVAIIDSGIDYTHPDLDDNYVDGYDFVNGDDYPMDDDGHGTHVAGTVAAEDNEQGVVGVAPEAELYALKVLGPDGSGNYSDVIAALQWAVDNDIQVTNNSYGSSGDPGELVKAAFDNAEAQGLLNVCAAGNNGNPPGRGDNVIYPARYESCIAVAATDQSDSRARWSSTGPDLELSAPGVSINSTLLDGGYGTGSGTSMASPHVAGTAALMIANGVTDVRGTLVATADDLADSGWDPKYGYGLVNAAAAAGIPEGPSNDPPTVSIISPADGSTFDSGGTIVFEGTATDTEDGDLTATLVWTSNIDGQIGTGGSFSTTLSDGTHTITASVTDSGGTTGSDSISITVMAPGAAMHVDSIVTSLSTKNAGRNIFTKALATVTIVDADSAPVAGATVSGRWSGATSDTDSGVTDSTGEVTLSSDAVKNASGEITFTFTVDNVVKSGWTYDEAANTETSDSISVP